MTLGHRLRLSFDPFPWLKFISFVLSVHLAAST